MDLNTLDSFTKSVAKSLAAIKSEGARAAVREILA